MKEKFTVHHDFVFAGGSVLRIGENIITASDVYVNSQADDKPCINCRLNKGQRKDYFEGDVLDIEGNFALKIISLKLAEDRAKGSIYLKKVSK